MFPLPSVSLIFTSQTLPTYDRFVYRQLVVADHVLQLHLCIQGLADDIIINPDDDEEGDQHEEEEDL